MSELSKRQMRVMPGPLTPQVIQFRAIVAWIVQSAFPIALLIALNGWTVRRYFHNIGEPSLVPAKFRKAIAKATSGAAGSRLFVGFGIAAALLAMLHVGLTVRGVTRNPFIGELAAHVFGACFAAAAAVICVRRSRAPILGAVSALIAIVLSVHTAAAPYKPRTIDEVVAQIRENTAGATKREEARRAFDQLVHHVPESTGAALRLARDDDPNLSAAATKWLGGWSTNPDHEKNSRWDEVRAERKLAAPVLVKRALKPDDGNDGWDVVEAFARVGFDSEAAGPLVDAMKTSNNRTVLRRCARILYPIKTTPPDGAVDGFRELMAHPDNELAELATRWFVQQQRNAPEIFRAMRGTNPDARAHAYNAVSDLLSLRIATIEQIVPVLLDGTRDDDPRVRERSVDSLANLTPKKEGFDLMLRLFREAKDDDGRKRASYHFRRFGEAPERRAGAVEKLLALIDDPNPDLRRSAIEVFGEEWLQDSIPYDRMYAFATGTSIDRKTAPRRGDLVEQSAMVPRRPGDGVSNSGACFQP